MDEIQKLSVAERTQLLEDIWDSIAEDAAKVPLTPAQVHDLDRRMSEYEADPTNTRTWTEVRERLERES